MRRLQLIFALLLLPAFAPAARAEHEYAPEHAAATVQGLRLRCAVSLLCPLASDIYEALSLAVAGNRDAEYRLGHFLEIGELTKGVARDEYAAIAWYGKAAEQGHAKAALALNAKRHAGSAVDVDDAKIAAALQGEIGKGDTDAMRALADMAIYGRGVPRSAERALQLLRQAADKGSADAEVDLASLYMIGAPGIAANPAEGVRWLVAAGRHGDLESMYRAGFAYLRSPDAALRDPAEGYRWLMRASLLDYPRAQEDLAGVLADGVIVGAKVAIAPDPVRADMWFRLAARSPFHDNPSIRYHIETGMTSAQLDAAKKLAADFRPLTLAEALAMAIDPPPVAGGAARPWPPGLMGAALDVFKQAGDNPEPWQRLPDFDDADAVMAAMHAIAEHCAQQGQRSCADLCRRQADDLAPPIKPGGVPFEELPRYLREHPEISPSRLMRKQPATAEEAMRNWVTCAARVADRP